MHLQQSERDASQAILLWDDITRIIGLKAKCEIDLCLRRGGPNSHLALDITPIDDGDPQESMLNNLSNCENCA